MRLKWPGFNENGTLLIELAPESFCLTKQKINVVGETFTAKEELHVTLTDSTLGLIIQDKIKQNQTINKLLVKTFEEIDWSYEQTGPVHILSRTIKNNIQKSIIMCLEMQGMTEFYDQLKSLELIEPGTPVPPPHVTLYTHNCPLGIGVPSDETLDALSIKTLTVKKLNKLAET